MLNILILAKNAFFSRLTRGRSSQEFLGAKWIKPTLNRIPDSCKRAAAMWFLSLSFHYFFKSNANRHLNTRQFLEFEFNRNQESRRSIIEEIVRKYSRDGDTVLDYGCGPGFMAKALSPYVKQVIACDISEGVIACASVLNGAPNVQYIVARQNGEIPIADASIDLVYSFAVIQHVTDDAFHAILMNLHRALKDYGTFLCHIIIDQSGWRTESEWKDDETLKGKLKWEYGLHCFSRTTEDVMQAIIAAGFSRPDIFLIRDIGKIKEDDIQDQHLFVFRKNKRIREFNTLNP